MRSLIFAASVLLFSVTSAQAGSLPVVDDPIAKSECSDCHMAYPPILLPQASWEKILGNLSDHFGDDASLDDATVKSLTEYFVKNSNDVVLAKYEKIFEEMKAAKIKEGKNVKFLRPPGMLRTAKKWSSKFHPERIQDLPRFRSKHNFSARCLPIIENVMKRAKIQTMAMCSDCHASMPITGGSAVILPYVEALPPAERQSFLSAEELKCLDD
ncbi:MAG: hypothetical protein COB59_03225 [Rhodospirillaceae bacterium]|nr:MAG: hypothetical protein COB59_03225 [Rhodospirillaceae bacterium]